VKISFVNILLNLDINITSDPLILYEIGKICAKSILKPELGLMCLDDFINITKFQNNYKLTDYYEKKKLKAKFWIGVIHIQLKEYK